MTIRKHEEVYYDFLEQRISDLEKAVVRLTDHVNREIGVAQNMPLCGRVAALDPAAGEHDTKVIIAAFQALRRRLFGEATGDKPYRPAQHAAIVKALKMKANLRVFHELMAAARKLDGEEL